LLRKREGKGVVGGEQPDGTDREEAMAAFGGESGGYEPGTTWGALYSLLCGALGFVLRGFWIASRDGAIGPFEELPRCQFLFTTVAVSGILLVVICRWGRGKVIATILRDRLSDGSVCGI
jgi:hypothetical protein